MLKKFQRSLKKKKNPQREEGLKKKKKMQGSKKTGTGKGEGTEGVCVRKRGSQAHIGITFLAYYTNKSRQTQLRTLAWNSQYWQD